MTLRFGQVLGLRPERLAEYRAAHAAVWPEILAALTEATSPRRYPTDELINLGAPPLPIGIVHYASDTPFSRHKQLLSKSMSFFGMDATYACAVAIVRRIFELEIARLGS